MAFARGEPQSREQRIDRSFGCIEPGDVASERTETSIAAVVTHLDLIRFTTLYNANGGEGLQLIAPAECFRWRVIDHAITGMDSAQRRGFAVADLHDSPCAPPPNVLGGGDC